MAVGTLDVSLLPTIHMVLYCLILSNNNVFFACLFCHMRNQHGIYLIDMLC